MCSYVQFGDSAVQYAAYNGHMEAVKLLIEQHHADATFVNQVLIEYHCTYLINALHYETVCFQKYHNPKPPTI